MGTLWERDGHLLSNDEGTALLECDECPCGEAPCVHCVGGSPDAYLIRIAGFVNPFHPECEDLNGDFVVTRTGEEIFSETTSRCIYEGIWNCSDPPDEYIGCLLLILEICWGMNGVAGMSIYVRGFRLTDFPLGTGPYFLDIDVPNCDCLDWADRDIPLLDAGGLLMCGADAATCHITAIP